MAEVAALILAAGRASRFRATSGLATKLIAPYHGQAMVRHVALAALASRARPVLVVTGHAREAVEAALHGLPVRFVHNADYASGLAGSLRTGLASLPIESMGALILLGDMPQVQPATCNALIDGFAVAPKGTRAMVPVWQGRMGNPVLLARNMFNEMAGLTGDQGARRLLPHGSVGLVQVAVEDAGILIDVDTPEALAKLE